MIFGHFVNNEAIKVTKKEKAYFVEVATQRLDEGDFYFFLKQRDNDGEIRLDFTLIRTQGKYAIYQVKVSFPPFNKELAEKEIWDLYIFQWGKEGQTKKRIKTKDEDLFQLSVLLPDRKMFYPYKTKNDRLSFSYESHGLFSNVHDVELKGNEFIFSGTFFYPPMTDSEYKVTGIHLIAEAKNKGAALKIPAEFTGGPEWGFKVAFPIDTYKNYNKKIMYKFYLQMNYEHNGYPQAIISKRLKWVQARGEEKSRVIQTPHGKVKVNAFRTKGYGALTVDIYKYVLKKELIEFAKTKWVHFRRGDFVQTVYKSALLILGALPKKKNLIIFESFHGKQYSDSPRAIYEYMRKNRMPYEMYWSADRRHLESFKRLENVNYVRRFSFKWLLLMARAQYWVTNARLPLWLPKPRGTIYLQTWHGTPLKRLAADIGQVRMPGTSTEKYKENFLFEASKWDYLVSPNAYSSKIFRRAFGFDKKMIESGYPRNDFLINENKPETVAEIKKSCNLPMDKKVILYAPTWRDNQFYTRGKYKFDLQMDLERMKEKFGDEYVIVLRLHYLVAENLDLSGYEGFVFDFSQHEDIRELYLIADLLITDYSSVFFDYANLKRPMIFFVYDIEDYRDNLRGFYFDFEEKAPGPLVKNTDELIAEIQKLDEEGFTPSANIEEFYARFCYLEDGRASERVVSEVFGARPPVR